MQEPQPINPTDDPNDYAAPEPSGAGWIFLNAEGLRAGWAAGLFIVLTGIFYISLQILYSMLGLTPLRGFTPQNALVEKLMEVGAVVLATLLMARLDELSLRDIYLDRRNRGRRLAEGLLAGFLAVSAIVGVQAAGGWMRLGGPDAGPGTLVFYGALWALVFLATGIAEEGAFRCYLQRTLARGLNFGWALVSVAVLCALAWLRTGGQERFWGIAVAALAGVFPCLLFQLRKWPEAPFWQAAWVTSVFFGFWHLGNSGESWVGIFAAALVGFVFCLSVRLTGTLWWAIGCHTAWDWSETYFWGAADSGLPAQGHLLAVTPRGNPLLSGGDVGPEGSLLALAGILALAGALVLLYRRGNDLTPPLAISGTDAGPLL